MDYREETHAVLAARHYLYELFQTLFGNEPTEQLLEAVDCAVFEEAFSLVLGSDAEALDGNRLVKGIEGFRGQLSAMEADYTAAFVGPHELPAPPWESVYTSGNRLLFQVSTLEIREAYRAQGLLPEQYPRVADDHIALELDFLARLAKRALEAYVQQDAEVFAEAIEASRSFVYEHLGVWVDAFAGDLSAWNKESFYAGAACTLAAFVHADKGFLSDVKRV